MMKESVKMGDKFWNDWTHWGWSQPYYNAIVKIVDEKEKKGKWNDYT